MNNLKDVPKDIEFFWYEDVHLAASPTVNMQYRFSNHSKKWKEIKKGTMNGYTQVSINEKMVRMHIILAKHWSIWEEGKDIDHADGDKSNNVKANLRAASRSENMYNQGKKSTNTSGYAGVCWHKASGKWMARIRYNKRQISLGYYDNINEAYIAYCEAAMNLHGEFANYDRELYEECLLLVGNPHGE